MPRVALTDITVRTLKPTGQQVQYWDASLPNFGCRLNQSGTKTFNVMLGTKRRLVKIGNYPAWTLAMARKRAHELMEDAETTVVTYEAARQLFFDRHLATLKTSTAHEQRNLMRRFPFSKPLSKITQEDITRVLNDMSRGSARCCYNVFRTFLNWCVANGYLDQTPLKGRSPYKASQRDRLLSDEEIALIWETSFRHGTWGSITRCLILSGQRLNQFCCFKTEWVKGDLIEFPPEVMKHNQTHHLPLTPTLRAHLPHLHKPFTSISDAMNRFRAELQIPHHTAHDYRRYHSSLAARQRTPIDVEEAILAHTAGSRSQVQRIYDRYDRLPEQRLALERHENFLRSLGLFTKNG